MIKKIIELFFKFFISQYNYKSRKNIKKYIKSPNI